MRSLNVSLGFSILNKENSFSFLILFSFPSLVPAGYTREPRDEAIISHFYCISYVHHFIYRFSSYIIEKLGTKLAITFLSLSLSLTHRECIRELGEPVMEKAYQLLDKVDPEQAEVCYCGASPQCLH